MAILIDGKTALEAKASGVFVYNVKLKDTLGAESTFNGRIEFMTPKSDATEDAAREAEKPVPPKYLSVVPDTIM